MIFLVISLVLKFLFFFIPKKKTFFVFSDLLETNKTDYIDFQEVDDALRPIFEEIAHNEIEQEAITQLCQFVCDQLRL